MADADVDVDKVRAALRKLAGGNKSLRTNGRADRVAKAANLDTTAVRRAYLALRDAGEIRATAWSAVNEPVGTLYLELRAEAQPAWHLTWRSVLAEATHLNTQDRQSLEPLAQAVREFDAVDMRRLLDGLMAMKCDVGSLQHTPMFVVSASYLLGSSKILSRLNPQALLAFGIDTKLFVGTPGILLTAGPANPDNVVFVENPHAFQRAIASEAIARTAFVATFGYGLSNQADEAGKQLATLLTSERTLTGAACAGTPPDLSSLLRWPRMHFWGDLDREALKIYERLKAKLPKLAISAIYEPMIASAVDLAGSHPYNDAVGKLGQGRPVGRESVVAKMLEICCERGIDQETIPSSMIATLARHELSIDRLQTPLRK